MNESSRYGHMNEIISNKHWDGPLDQFARSTGFVVCLYSCLGDLISGPHVPNPISLRYRSAGLWDQNGIGQNEEKIVLAAALNSRQLSKHMAFGKLPVMGIPLISQSEVIGVLTLGWMFDHFADPVEADRLASIVKIPPLELWSLIRQHVPQSEEKLRSYAELLKTISQSLILELINNQVELKTSRILRILNQSALELTAAFSVSDIEKAASNAVRDLTQSNQVLVHFVTHEENKPRALKLESMGPILNPSKNGRQSVPIESSDGTLLGLIEVDLPISGQHYQSELAALASQVAVAFQKVKLISDLQKERGHLRFTLEELRRASLIRDQFLTTLSHELRTPLTAVLGWCQILKEEDLDEERTSYALQTIERNAKAQAQLIEDLLDASRIISGKMLMKIESGDLVSVIHDSLKTIRPAADRKGITLTTIQNIDQLMMFFDPVRIQQIFWNLLSNAVKFTPENGNIRIDLHKDDDAVSIKFVDSGVGIKREFLSSVFDRFSQADSSYARNYGGLGLGLAIVKQLIELHGGSIGVDSLGEGHGTTFTVRLPLGDINTHLQNEFKRIDDFEMPSLKMNLISEETPSAKAHLTDVKILVVDDTLDTLDLIKLFTKKEGAIVETAGSADDGLIKFNQFDPDFVISDISMPGKDGFQFISDLKHLMQKRKRTVPVVAVTAYTGEEDRKKVLGAGFSGHIGKPISRQSLIETIGRVRQMHSSQN